MSARATEVFGSGDKAMRWLETPVPALGFRTPLSLMSSQEGFAEMEDTLGAIEHGIWERLTENSERPLGFKARSSVFLLS